jgi:serine phosphatase RsbU (regulator of sigma subunit)/tetratricopeptide (TPR) repeat protein
MRFRILRLTMPVLFMAGSWSFYACTEKGPGKKANPFEGIKAANTVDSLFALLKKSGPDTLRAYALNRLCWHLRRNNPDTSIILGNQALELSEKLQWLRGLAEANHNLAVVYRTIGNYEKAIGYNNVALGYATQLKDSSRIASTIGNLGSVYYTQGDYPRALEYYLAALKIAELRNEKQRIATQLGNIGSIYIHQGDYKTSISCFSRALRIDEENKDQAGIAFDLAGIAGGYLKQAKPDTALMYYSRALEIEKVSGSKYGMARAIGNIGMCWSMRADSTGDPVKKKIYYDSAIYFNRQAYDLSEAINDNRGRAINLGELGQTYIDVGRFREAEATLLKAIALCDSLGIPESQKDDEANLSFLYDSLHEYKKALWHYQRFISLRDTLINEDKTKEILRDQMNFEFEKKTAIDAAKSNEELARQKVIRNASVAGGLLLLIIAGMSLRAYRMKKKAGEIIEKQKAEVESQKLLVEEKQKEIIDSITYAKRIQSAILPATGEIENHFGDAFVFFRPKDIVSGDFYWMAKTKDYTFIAAADCTGHGVPGGFMSMLGNSLLNEVVLEKHIVDPAEILDMLRVKIILALKQKGESGENKDGMDMALCRFSNDQRELHFACANNPVWICRNGVMTEFRPDKQPVGIGGVSEAKMFTGHHFKTEPGDCVYLFTDGFADQFGGEKGKKFMYRRFKEMLVANSALPMKIQQEKLEAAFAKWKGGLEQVDDLLVIGIKVK